MPEKLLQYIAHVMKGVFSNNVIFLNQLKKCHDINLCKTSPKQHFVHLQWSHHSQSWHGHKHIHPNKTYRLIISIIRLLFPVLKNGLEEDGEDGDPFFLWPLQCVVDMLELIIILCKGNREGDRSKHPTNHFLKPDEHALCLHPPQNPLYFGTADWWKCHQQPTRWNLLWSIGRLQFIRKLVSRGHGRPYQSTLHFAGYTSDQCSDRGFEAS